MGDLISIEIHKGPWKTGNAIKPKAPKCCEACEEDYSDIIYILVGTVVESNKKVEDHLNLWKLVQTLYRQLGCSVNISIFFFGIDCYLNS
jgi:hypothetical protein